MVSDICSSFTFLCVSPHPSPVSPLLYDHTVKGKRGSERRCKGGLAITKTHHIIGNTGRGEEGKGKHWGEDENEGL